jgi:thiamine-phosphate pyrophosphorylase
VTGAHLKNAISGLYAVTPDAQDTQLLLEHVEAALAGGARLLQYRNKSASVSLRLDQARALKSLCDRYDVPLIVNDRVDIARTVDAAGVHLGAEDGSALAARHALGTGKIIGISCYNSLERGRQAQREGADYLAFGSFFPSTIKPGAVHASVELLTEAKREFALPLVAIGGITLINAPQLLTAGADALAVISALFDAEDICGAARGFGTLLASRA